MTLAIRSCDCLVEELAHEVGHLIGVPLGSLLNQFADFDLFSLHEDSQLFDASLNPRSKTSERLLE